MIPYVLAVLWRAGICAVVGAAVMLWAARALRARSAACWIGGSLVGYLAGHIAISAIDRGWRQSLVLCIQPVQALDYLPAIVCCVAAVDWASHIDAGRRRLYLALYFPLAIASATRLLWGSRDYLPSPELRATGFVPDAWTPLEAAICIGGIGLAWGASCLAWSAQSPVEQPRWRGALAIVTSGVAVGIVAHSGSVVFAAHFLLLAALAAGCTLAAEAGGMEGGIEGASGLWNFVFGSLLILSCVYADLSGFSAAALGVSWFAASGRLPRSLRRRPSRDKAWRGAICLAALGAGVGALAL